MHLPDRLDVDPLKRLLSSEDEVLRAFVRYSLLNERNDLRTTVLSCKEVRKLLSSQKEDGSWRASGKRKEMINDRMVTTFKSFRTLVLRYELDRSVGSVIRAAECLFSFQTDEGDFRGMIGGQYATYYTGEIISLLVRAGYQDDKRIDDGMEWLIGIRQDDGGWTIPILSRDLNWDEIIELTGGESDPLPPDRTKPFSHNWTDMVLRAFAAHPSYRYDPEARHAADLLKQSFFRPDAYRSYKGARYWTRFVAWWPNLLTALETLNSMDYDRDDPDIRKAILWFIEHQRQDGLWDLEDRNPGKPRDREWLSLRICRMLRSYGIG